MNWRESEVLGVTVAVSSGRFHRSLDDARGNAKSC